MAETKDDGGYSWLPAHFLTDDDFLIGGENLKGSIDSPVELNGNSHMTRCFDPFCYSSSLNSPVDSVISSTGTDSDRDEFVSELTRQLAESSLHDTRKFSSGSTHGTPAFCINRDLYEKPRVLLGSSPQSTLNGFGGWSELSNRNVLSPASSPTTPLGVNLDAWELIYAAAGEVARLKMNAQLQQNRGLLGSRQNPCQAHKTYNIGGLGCNPAFYPEFPQLNQTQQMEQPVGRSVSRVGQGKEQGWYCQQMQTRGTSGRGCMGVESGRCGGALGHSAWPPMRNHHPHTGGSDMRAVVLGGSAPVVKKKSIGTGVFLPRRPSEPRQKSGCSTVLLPARVAQALNLDLDEKMNAPSQPCFANGYNPDHDILMARRNALIMAQQKQRMLLRTEGAMMMAHETRLPRDWTY